MPTREANRVWSPPRGPAPELRKHLVKGAFAPGGQPADRKGLRILVGSGTCGLGAGAARTREAIAASLARRGVEADLVATGCVGLCSEEPIVDVVLPGRGRISHGPIGADRVEPFLDRVLAGEVYEEALLGRYRNGEKGGWAGAPLLEEHPFFRPQRRLVLANCGIIVPTEIDEYIAQGGYSALARVLAEVTPDQTCDQVVASGLRGRGGGGFPTGRKWRIAHDQPGGRKYLICNADEGDPGAFMDRALIEGDPHRLLEGLCIGAYAIGARLAYIYIRAEYPLAIENLRTAIAQARDYGILGDDIFASGFRLDIRIKQGAGAFVCGEETALIHSIEGKRGMPGPRPPYPAVAGLFGRPTVINNVETLANVPVIFAEGPEAFAALGTESSKGTKVFALSGKVGYTGLLEVPMGTTIREIVMDAGGGIPGGKACKAVQMGGPSGGCIPASHLDIEIDYESLKEMGAMMGSGGMVVMDEETCMVDLALFFMEFIQKESCGKCIPCREGTKRMKEILEAITRGRRSEEGLDSLRRFQGVVYLQELAEIIRDTSLCGLGQTAPNPVLSTLRWFRDEYEAHVFERRCPAGQCAGLLVYRIDPDKCRGCTLCAKACPSGAVKGARKAPHYIVTEKCIGCGACLEACRFDAVLAE